MASKVAWRARLILTALAGSVCLLSGLAALELTRTSGAPVFLPLAEAHLNRARSLIASGGRDSLDMAEAETRIALRLSPKRTDAWLTLAYIDDQRGGDLTPVFEDLERTYSLAPLDPDVMSWRVRFALEHWPKLPDDLKAKVDREILAGWMREGARKELRQMAMDIRDPAGRQVLQDKIVAFDRNPPDLPKADAFEH
jgi:hypothetical protein